MTTVILTAEVVFYATDRAWPSFPLSGPRRMSLWAPDAPGPTPAEFQLQAPLEAEKLAVVRILAIRGPVLEAHLQVGRPILFGTYPRPAGEGRILRLEPYEHEGG